MTDRERSHDREKRCHDCGQIFTICNKDWDEHDFEGKLRRDAGFYPYVYKSAQYLDEIQLDDHEHVNPPSLDYHICTYWDKLKRGWGNLSYSIIDGNNVEMVYRSIAINGPKKSNGYTRSCSYCRYPIYKGEVRYRVNNDISFHPDCFKLHCHFVSQIFNNIAKKVLDNT